MRGLIVDYVICPDLDPEKETRMGTRVRSEGDFLDMGIAKTCLSIVLRCAFHSSAFLWSYLVVPATLSVSI
jgi:hypothetical protein